MVKSAVIFSDEEQNKKEERFHPVGNDKISLTREDYRQLIKEAYEEGKDDALNEQKKTQQQHSGQEFTSHNQKRAKTSQKSFKKEIEAKRTRHTEVNIPEKEKESMEFEGKEEAMRVHAKEKQENLQRFKTITARHEIEIMRTQSIFPFSLFPDTLVIDTTKVTISRKQLFATEFVATIPLKDLADVTMQTALFFGSVMIKYMPQTESLGMGRPIDVKILNLKRKDAIKAKNILKGALVAKAEEIDIAKLPPEEVVKVLEKFGGNEGVV